MLTGKGWRGKAHDDATAEDVRKMVSAMRQRLRLAVKGPWLAAGAREWVRGLGMHGLLKSALPRGAWATVAAIPSPDDCERSLARSRWSRKVLGRAVTLYSVIRAWRAWRPQDWKPLSPLTLACYRQRERRRAREAAAAQLAAAESKALTQGP